ncbi:MAG: diaminopimelate decarboxylase [Syntrophales bacterium]|jgi:diaminopimelate decarboxylase|nr:diaminopimelate decarboxylase [Syntrophales bacterium]MDY0044617.1 diaminopimelate decarboxylase [Syntrophales bacterium]
MNYFSYIDNELYCEEVAIANIAAREGTPFYLYSLKTLKRHYQVFDRAFADVPHLICFSAKANSNIAILKALVMEGAGMDIVSGGELFRAMKAGADPKKIVFSGVGKRQDEIEYALSSGILMFNIESSQELETVNAAAGKMNKKAPIALRVNPDVDAGTHPHISTGMKENKFGIDIAASVSEYRRAKELEHIEIVGIDCHLGSQITEVDPFIHALDRLKKLVATLRRERIEIKYLDLGGGLGIMYDNEDPPHPDEYARAILKKTVDMDCTFILEPGRVIAGNSGVLIAKILYTKEREHKNFVIVDAGMNDLIRPSLYGSYHKILPVTKGENEKKSIIADVVGPICESGDFFAKARRMPPFAPNDLIAVMSAGAYGFTMSSNYNSRPRCAEVLVNGDRYDVIRKREKYEDLVKDENIPDYLHEYRVRES